MMLLSLFGFTVFMPALTTSLPVLLIAFVLGGVGQEACDVVKMTAMRKEIPEKYRGRAFSADFFSHSPHSPSDNSSGPHW